MTNALNAFIDDGNLITYTKSKETHHNTNQIGLRSDLRRFQAI